MKKLPKMKYHQGKNPLQSKMSCDFVIDMSGVCSTLVHAVKSYGLVDNDYH